ncbi:hypothetical protein NARC_40234 [Candidatus Nitrosocosmicus arcticus]|uniref:Uncharacterized protein n=1 Tax=Candidatus Nitrosocosmicus arcticus TaxID=2035267 RepID=A0A557SXF9_9ARCH|nr:hypothetical protein NARC_40234 [Candidatus Nitrosocosmicus arcticus]
MVIRTRNSELIITHDLNLLYMTRNEVWTLISLTACRDNYDSTPHQF